ncbi:TonB-dependent receptor [Filimonas lacunae]|nr:TonB-dependent receptor [Filimonas lacunae]
MLVIGMAICAAYPAVSHAQVPLDTLRTKTVQGYKSKTITGRVTDEKGAALEHAVVQAKGTGVRTLTQDNGSFKITMPDSVKTISISHINMKFAEINISNQSNMSITMQPMETTLNDLIVVGYGTKKKSDVLGAVASIKADILEDIPVANMGSALRDRLPGVGVSIASGKPGAATTLTIRNSTIFAGASNVGVTADPLYVIDGITVTKQDFDNLDASLVESLTFLKDAAAAIYGASGAKGVVLVTTRKGRPGKTRISYSGYFGTSTEAIKPKTMSAYEHAKMLNDGYELNNTQIASRFSQADLDYLKTNPYQSWYDQIWKSGTLNRHTINVSGGTEKVTFFAGGNYYDEKGNYGDISIKKYGIRSGMTAKVTDEITATVMVAMDYSKDYRGTYKTANGETDDVSIRALYLTPKWVPLTIDGKPVNWSGPNPPGAYNPVGMQNSGNYTWNTTQGLNLNATLEYRPKYLKGLIGKFQYGKLNRNGFHKEYYPNYTVYNFVRTGQNLLLYSNTPTTSPTSKAASADQLGTSTLTASSYQIIASLAYSKHFKNQDFDIMGAMDQSEGNSMESFIYKNGQIISGVDEFWAFNNATAVIRNPSYTNSAKRSFLGRMNYTLFSKYYLEVIARYDASSNFAPGNRWGLFPSVGIGWKISDEKFFSDNITFINFLKLRANYGLVGEDRVNARLWQSRYTQTTGALLGTTSGNGLDPNIAPNPDITWEKARTINVGLDASVLNNRLTIGIDLYRRQNYDGFDKLENGALPATTGINTAVVNYGRSTTWGSEFSIGYRGVINKDWGFSTDVNFGFSNGVLEQAYYNALYIGTYGNNELGLMVGRNPQKYNSSNFGYISKGILRTQAEVDALLAKNPNYKIGGAKPQVGFLNFEDINGDGQINDLDVTTMFNRTTTVIGFGITLGVTYKTFKLSTNINLAVGGKKFVDGEAKKVPTTTQNAPSFWNDHWTPDNPNAKYPRADAPLAKENSTFWALNGTQCRINNMTLSYAVPKPLAERLGIPELRAFVTGTNLWTIINPFKYKDPYTSNFADYPTLRTISLGINATF